MEKILIVDDDYAIRLLYQVELEDEGYNVTTSCDCLTLMDQIKHLKPDLILLDVRLGEINGLHFLQEIRTQYAGLPIILCSAYPTFRYDMKAIGADYCITKSMDLSELKYAVKMALENIPKDQEIFPSQFQERDFFDSEEGELAPI